MSSFDARAVMERARLAQPAWAARSVAQRCAVLVTLCRVIARDCESIAQGIAQEVSKPLLDALGGDVAVTLEHLRYCEREAARVLRPCRARKPSLLFFGARFEVHQEPHGVALVIAPANYPLQLAMVPLTTALAAGNAVVLKCSERTPQTAACIARLLAEAGIPRDLVQVFADGPEQSIALIEARPDFLFFTGSSRNGRSVAERAAKLLVPTLMELGGKDAALVFADCHFERSVEGLTYAAFSNSGRVCVGARRVYVEIDLYERFLSALRERTSRLNVSVDADADLAPLRREEQGALHDQIAEALQQGARLIWPASLADDISGPVVLADVPADARLITEETFGPVVCVAPFVDESHAIELANEGEFALSSSVWTGDRKRARRVAGQLSAGSCGVNDVVRNIANPYAPFGGNRSSGHGRYHGEEGLRAFSRSKTVMFASSWLAREIQWFPHSESTRKQLITLLKLRHGARGVLAWLGRILLPIALCMVMPLAMHADDSTQAHLDVAVALTPHAHGELAYLIFATPTGFPGDLHKAVRSGFLTIPPNAQQMHIEADLPPGSYAVSVYEDLNGNHRLDHNFLGIPREPVGASNNPRPRMGPPVFGECVFHLGPKPQTISITLVQQ